MSAQVDLDDRREPAQVVRPVLARHDERGLGVPELGRDLLHPPGVGRRVQQDDAGRIAAEHRVGECVDDEGSHAVDVSDQLYSCSAAG